MVHLLAVQEQEKEKEKERFDLLVTQMAEREGMTEKLKTQDQLCWVKKINNIRARADEIVRDELIYQL